MPNDITDAAARSAKARKTLDRMRARAVKADEARTAAAHHARAAQVVAAATEAATANRTAADAWDARGDPGRHTKPTSAAAGPSWPTAAPGTGGRARSQRLLADEGWSVGAHGGLALAIACGVKHGECMSNASKPDTTGVRQGRTAVTVHEAPATERRPAGTAATHRGRHDATTHDPGGDADDGVIPVSRLRADGHRAVSAADSHRPARRAVGRAGGARLHRQPPPGRLHMADRVATPRARVCPCGRHARSHRRHGTTYAPAPFR